MQNDLSYLEAIVIGFLQGIAELFPISSLGHSILLPALIGGEWARDLSITNSETSYLAFVVALHVATAFALIIYFWRDWLRIIAGFFTSLQKREVKTSDQRLAWLLILGTIPVGIAGLTLEHTFRTTLGKPEFAAVFLTLNGIVLLLGEILRRGLDGENSDPEGSDERLSQLSFKNGIAIGAAQIAALAPGISRSGVTMVAGLLRGLSHEDSARFSFLLATPVILAAGVLKLPELFTDEGREVLPQILVGSLCSGVAAYWSVRFLVSYFETRTLAPYAIYSLIVGVFCMFRFTF